MTTDTDPRVSRAIELYRAAVSGLDEMGCATDASISGEAALVAYLAAEFAKVPSAPVDAVPAFHGFVNESECRVEMCFSPSAPRADGVYATAFYTRPVATTPPQSAKTENEIDRLETEVARLTAELQEVREDAGRYRWLRENSNRMHVHVEIHGNGAEISDTLDEAIDAAMTKDKPKDASQAVWIPSGIAGSKICVGNGGGYELGDTIVQVASEGEEHKINLIMALVWAAMLQAETRQENTKCAELYGRIRDAITDLVCDKKN